MPESITWTIPGPVPLPRLTAPDGAEVAVTLSLTEYGAPLPFPRAWASRVRAGVWSHPPAVRPMDLAHFEGIRRCWVCVTWAGRPVGAHRVKVVR